LGDSRRSIGLGLSLCRSIARAHGGAIHIADNFPNGTVVSFALNLEEVRLENERIGN
jgi:two-component system sensor histidine kinase KdpD